MSKASLREIMQERPALGVMSRIPSCDIMEMFARSGWDFVVIDMEHGPLTYETVLQEVRTAEAIGVIPLVRVSNNETVLIQKALDAGARGVVVPHITNKADAEKVVFSSRYAPDGYRGACNAVRATGYTALPWKVFQEVSNREVITVLLIEDKGSADEIDYILSVSHIDVIWVGTGDLSVSMGHGGNPKHPDVRAVRDQVIEKCRAKGVFPGANYIDEEDLLDCAERGVRFFSCGNEGSILFQASKRWRESLGSLLGFK
ncbi:MAG: hypothetical protein HYX92_03250 [Chloroflexi bacterium]|nr:hypothetical protein [Chloroflexota bacterium]